MYVDSIPKNSKRAIHEAKNKTRNRIIHISRRLPHRSPATPTQGDKREPINRRAPKAVRSKTDPVVVKIYQPRIRASISKPQEASKSAGHWKRKLLIRKGSVTFKYTGILIFIGKKEKSGSGLALLDQKPQIFF